jgi:hypothetical protein
MRDVTIGLAVLLASVICLGCGRAAPNRLPTGERVIVTPGKTELRAGKHRTIQAPGAPMLASFPKDIPIYPGAVFRIGSETDGKLFSTTLDVPMGNIAEIEAYYREFFAKDGWTIGLDHRSKNGGAMMQFRKEKRGCMVTVGTTDEGTTALSFMFNDKP